MKTLPANLIIEKNKMSTTSAWVVLVEIEDADGGGTNLRYAANNQNVTYDGDVYTALPLRIESTKETSKGEIPTVRLLISNITRVVHAYLEAYDGLVGKTVNVIVVNSSNLGEDYTELTMEFNIMDTDATDEWVSFTLGASNPLRKRFPNHRFMSGQCNWASKFKGEECDYSGSATVCDGTLRRCRELSNSPNFGGHPGLSKGNLKVV